MAMHMVEEYGFYYEYIHGFARRNQSTMVTHMVDEDGFYYDICR